MPENRTAQQRVSAATPAAEATDLHVPALPAPAPLRLTPRTISLGLYLIIVGGAILYVQTCQGMFCETATLLPALPWAMAVPLFRADDFNNLSLPQLAAINGVCYAINAWLCYRAGVLLESAATPGTPPG